MLDSFGRDIYYLRLSVTQRCNLRCTYCGAMRPDENELTRAQIAALVSAFAKVGITKVRLTGGEPLMREDIVSVAAAVGAVEGIRETALTTNGIDLAAAAKDLRAAGIGTVNISLDAMDPAVYRRLTGVDALGQVLSGLQAALSAGVDRVRVNSVLMRGINDGEVEALASLAKDLPIDVRFIELMPFFGSGKYKNGIVPAKEILPRLPALRPVPAGPGDTGIAAYYTAPGYAGRVGFISPVTEKFCASCNRIRLLSNGQVRPCLGSENTFDLMPYINDEAALMRQIRLAISAKPAAHRFGDPASEVRAMNKIGG